MKGRIDNLNILGHLLNIFRVDDLGFNSLNICVVNLFADGVIQSGLYRVRLRHSLNIMIIGHFIDLGNNLLIFRVSDLGAILPVNFVAVVFRRIMAGSDDDACHTAKLTHRK